MRLQKGEGKKEEYNIIIYFCIAFRNVLILSWKGDYMDELLLKYADEFDENFPMYLFRSEYEDEIKSIIQKCLDEGIPYEVPETLEGKY